MTKMMTNSTKLDNPRTVIIAAGLLLLVLGGLIISRPSAAPAAGGKQAIAVDTAIVTKRDIPIYISGLGTVQALYTVTISPRVDGELMKLGFTEGQMVKAGDLLAQIDPRPYQAALDQAVANKAKDVALLTNAKMDLERYKDLAPEEFTSKQTLDTQRALVAQTEAQIASDQAQIDNAKTQLSYTTIRSPIAGRTGIRLVDPGNILHTANGTGIVVVTQVQPISLVFTLPAEALQQVNQAMSKGALGVAALSRDGKTALGDGTIGVIDNLIDQTTGTMKLKASFPNKENRLWPGDFVNAKVLIENRKGALTIPSTAVQRNQQGVFTYVVKADNTVDMRPIKIGADANDFTIVESGLNEGERVTISNQYRLQPNALVKVSDTTPKAPPGTKAP